MVDSVVMLVKLSWLWPGVKAFIYVIYELFERFEKKSMSGLEGTTVTDDSQNLLQIKSVTLHVRVTVMPLY